MLLNLSEAKEVRSVRLHGVWKQGRRGGRIEGQGEEGKGGRERANVMFTVAKTQVEEWRTHTLLLRRLQFIKGTRRGARGGEWSRYGTFDGGGDGWWVGVLAAHVIRCPRRDLMLAAHVHRQNKGHSTWSAREEGVQRVEE